MSPDDDPTVCNVTVFDEVRGVLSVSVPVPDALIRNDEARDLYCDGVADGVAALASVLWPNDSED